MGFIKTFSADLIYGNRITAVIRIFFGLLLLMSSFHKVLDPAAFASIIMKYNIIQESYVPYAAIVVPWIECFTGLFLIIGYRVRASALIAMGLMSVFIVFVTINVIRGENFDCGCFQMERYGIGMDETIGITVIIRNFIMLAAYTVVFLARRHLFSLESVSERMDLKDL